MNTEFQNINGKEAFNCSDFENQEKFLKSWTTGSVFTIYGTLPKAISRARKISFKPVLKKLIIETVEPLNQKHSPYLVFTAKSVDGKDSYKGFINWG